MVDSADDSTFGATYAGPQTFGGFELLDVLGQGGMGIVHLARQLSTGREVALKLIRPDLLGQERARQRFRREIEAVSKLDDPGICTIYEAGEVEGAPYVAMRYIKGDTLLHAKERLLSRHLGGLRAFVRAKSSKVIRDKESCSDLAQTVCREVLGGIDNYEWRGEGSFRHWLFTVAINKIRNRADLYAAERRSPKRPARSVDDLRDAYASDCGPSQHAIAGEAIANFETALDQLSPDHREVILMSRMIGMTHPEIAAKLGIEQVTVRTRLARALSKLAKVMTQ